MNWKRLLYPLDGIPARLSEHNAAHEMAVALCLLLGATVIGLVIYLAA